MQATVSSSGSKGAAAAPIAAAWPAGKSAESVARHWKEKAHALADMVIKAEGEKSELRRQLGELRDAQETAADAVELAALRAELRATKAELVKQADALRQRQEALRFAAGAARAEVLSLRQINADLQAEVDGLLAKNAELQRAAKAPAAAAAAAATPLRALALNGQEQPAAATPGKVAHYDVATLQSMLRQRECELAVLREDSAAKQVELMHALAQLAAANAAAEDLRCEAASLRGQLDITREALHGGGDEDDAGGEGERARERALYAGLVEEAERRAAGLRADLAAKADAMAALRAELGRAADEAAALRAAVRERDAAAADLEAKLPALQRAVGELRGEVEAAAEGRGALLAELARLREQAAAAPAAPAESGSSGTFSTPLLELPGAERAAAIALLSPVEQSSAASEGSAGAAALSARAGRARRRTAAGLRPERARRASGHVVVGKLAATVLSARVLMLGVVVVSRVLRLG